MKWKTMALNFVLSDALTMAYGARTNWPESVRELLDAETTERKKTLTPPDFGEVGPTLAGERPEKPR